MHAGLPEAEYEIEIRSPAIVLIRDVSISFVDVAAIGPVLIRSPSGMGFILFPAHRPSLFEWGEEVGQRMR